MTWVKMVTTRSGRITVNAGIRNYLTLARLSKPDIQDLLDLELNADFYNPQVNPLFLVRSDQSTPPLIHATDLG